MRIVLMFGALLAFGAVFLAACGGGGDDSSSAATGPTSSDEEYLAAICQGTKDFSDAIVSKTKAEEIAQVIKDFSASMKKLTPPADLQQFNKDFTKYLDDSLNDPTQLLTRQPPEPPSGVRDRLLTKESNVSECKNVTTFFDAQAAASGTVAASPAAAPTK
jgi:hypothetical protein